MRAGFVFAALGFLLAVSSADAIVIEAVFEGQVTTVNAPLASGPVAVGDPVRGRFRFDAAITGSDTAPNVDTGHYGPLASLQYSIGTYSGGLGSGTSRFEIWDDRSSNDAYRIFAADPVGAEIAGHAPLSFILDLRDSTQSLFSSDAFPPTALARTDFTSGGLFFRFQQGGGPVQFIVADVTILMTPLPLAERWRVASDGGVGANFESADAIVVDASGAEPEVYAGGSLERMGTGLDFAVLKLGGNQGAERWRFVMSGTNNGLERASALALDPLGNIVAGGEVRGPTTGSDFAVLKLAAQTGGVVWDTFLDGTTALTTGSDSVLDLAVDPFGDVIAGGWLSGGVDESDFAVVKLAGGSGSELWRFTLDGGASGFDRVESVAVNGAGDVFAAGVLVDAQTGLDFAVFKLAGDTGAELWRYVIDGGVAGLDVAEAVTLDGDGNVLAVGDRITSGTNRALHVVKLQAGSGTRIWDFDLDGAAAAGLDFGEDVVVDGDDDIVVAAQIDNGATQNDFGVLKLDGGAGALLWRTEIDGSGPTFGDGAKALTIDDDNRVIVAGQLRVDTTAEDLAVVTLDGASGIEGGRGVVDGGDASLDTASAVAIDHQGGVYVAGLLDAPATGRDFAVVKLPAPAWQATPAMLVLAALQWGRSRRREREPPGSSGTVCRSR